MITMITLFAIVVVATLALAVTRAEGMRPLGLALVGMISLVLGARTTAVFTETSLAPLVDSMVHAQDSVIETPEATDASQATSSPRDETTDSGSETAESVTDAPKGEVAATPQTKATESNATATEDATNSTTSQDAVAAESQDAVAAETAPAAPVASPDASKKDAPASPATPLTVEAITNVQYLDRGDGTPSWLESKPWTQDGVRFVPVASRLQISETDRDSALDLEIKQATDAYINELLKNKHATTLLKLRSASAIPKVMGSFEEQVVVTAGTMHQAHALLAFEQEFRDAVTAEWAEVRAASRLMQTGLGAWIVVLLLSTMFGYFKVDTATRGYYTGRLQFAAAAAILAVIAVSVLFANYVPWM